MTALLLAIDALLNLLLGALMASFPGGLIAWLGLPDAHPRFYARILGAVLIGIALALMVEIWKPGAGLGLQGAIAINLSAAVMLAALLLAPLELSRRGRVLLWGLVAVLVGLSVVELWAGP